MVVVLVRHGERLDYRRKQAWIDGSKRPWDTPLTEHGHEQGKIAGEEISRKLKELGLPPATRIYSSPFTRCVETSVALRKGLEEGQKIEIALENSLGEALGEDWYRSWALAEKSDSTWGGPPGFETGSGYEGVKLRSQAHVPANQLLKTRADFADVDNLNKSHVSVFLPGYTIETPEEHDIMRARIGRFAAAAAHAFPDETIVLCSHGGPLATLFNYLTGEHCPPLGFTAISILQRAENAQTLDEGNPLGPGANAFHAHLTASTNHLDSAEDLGLQTAFTGKEEELTK
ncbi:Ubiquitin-associated and SH3 domain-containing protein B [Hondaea fermentalgiana]|uniref:Ubiquitin-associated and SH3 domain-containing protein B n=1 Tax=Hondaea fermentalgiana TaxID=2315210 RepID=A0A2R5G877_9STRA|nr:Ubiquitin-associated and SH3 domain-containing protein B [Hondaea fermentalgiana]|eukprot:GBG27247.1 Ubiquitin-associated and SH3 domain-containing protein B [Hondaea fermentalgiana]